MIADNLHAVAQRIAQACTQSGQPADSVRLLAVSKTFGPEAVQQAFDAGQEILDQMAESLSASESRTLLSLLQRMTESLTESVTNVIKTADEV